MKVKDIRLNFFNFNIFYKIVDIVHLLIALYLSESLFDSIIYGGIIFVISSFFMFFYNVLVKKNYQIYSKSSYVLILILFLFTLTINHIITANASNIIVSTSYLFMVCTILLLCGRVVVTDYISAKLKDTYVLRFCVNLLIHVLFLVGIAFALYNNASLDAFNFILIVCVIETIFLLPYQIRNKEKTQSPKEDLLKEVASYKNIKSMAFYAYAAFYLSIFMYFIYLFNSQSVIDYKWYIGVSLWFLILLVVLIIVYKLLKNKNKITYGATFVFGAILWVVSLIMIFNANDKGDIIWWSLLWSSGTGVMSAVLTRLNETFKLVSNVIDVEVTDSSLMNNTIVLHETTLLLSEVITLLLLTILLLVPTDEYLSKVLLTIIGYIPLLFILISAIIAVSQPIDYFTIERLKRLESGYGNDELKTKLNRILVKKHKTNLIVKLILFMVRVLYHHKVYGEENVKQDKLPAIFVCNHGEFYGPVVAVTYLPYYFRPWIESQLLDWKQGYPYTYKYTFSQIKFLPTFIKKWLAKTTVKLGEWAFNAFDPIPVYRSDLRSIMKTFDISVKALKEDDSVLLFPESTHGTEDGKYAKGGQIGDFYTGFAHIGLKYYLETGKAITFYPIYASKKKRKFIIGEGIEFNPNNDKKEEKTRIANELRDAMSKLGGL